MIALRDRCVQPTFVVTADEVTLAGLGPWAPGPGINWRFCYGYGIHGENRENWHRKASPRLGSLMGPSMGQVRWFPVRIFPVKSHPLMQRSTDRNGDGLPNSKPWNIQKVMAEQGMESASKTEFQHKNVASFQGGNIGDFRIWPFVLTLLLLEQLWHFNCFQCFKR